MNQIIILIICFLAGWAACLGVQLIDRNKFWKRLLKAIIEDQEKKRGKR